MNEPKNKKSTRSHNGKSAGLGDAPVSRYGASTGGIAAPRQFLENVPEKSGVDSARLMLQECTLPAVLATNQGDIVYIHGCTGNFLEPAVGKANWNIFAMARDGLSSALSSAFRQALHQPVPVTVKGAKVETDSDTHLVDLTVHRVDNPEALRGMILVVFKDLGPAPHPRRSGRNGKGSSTRIQALEDEFEQRREDNGSFRQELLRAQGELGLVNEELLSSNEELATSKEEMQSLREELSAINLEQQVRLADFSRLNSDMKNFLDSAEVAAIFLDNDQKVRLFTRGARQLFKLIPRDVGRPLSDITSELSYPTLFDDAQQVLDTMAPHDLQCPASGGRWFSVRIVPYHTLENTVGGVVITFSDIKAEKFLEQELQDSELQARNVVGGMSHGFAILEGNIDAPSALEQFWFSTVNPGFQTILGIGEQLMNRPLKEVEPLLGPDFGPALIQCCRDLIDSGTFQVRVVGDPKRHPFVHLNVYRVAPSRLACVVVNLASDPNG